MNELTEEIKNYILQAAQTPVMGVSQIVSMVILHFDIPDKDADWLVAEVLRGRNVLASPHREEVTKILKAALTKAYNNGRAGNQYIPEEVMPALLKELDYG